jgi:hypothetical protein
MLKFQVRRLPLHVQVAVRRLKDGGGVSFVRLSTRRTFPSKGKIKHDRNC